MIEQGASPGFKQVTWWWTVGDYGEPPAFKTMAQRGGHPHNEAHEARGGGTP